MKKDKAWLKGKINAFQEGENMFTAEFNAGVQDALEYVQELINQLDEPEKVVIPKFVADWIEKQMKFGYEDVFISMTRLRERAPEKVKFWFHNNADTYAKAWLDGYEVEKEKKYYVAFEDINLLYVTRVEVCGENEKLNYSSESSTENAMKFIDKEKASSLAYFLGAIVVEATQ